eukprot:jgi/Tetstr1/444870/TSEL_032712.t1
MAGRVAPSAGQLLGCLYDLPAELFAQGRPGAVSEHASETGQAVKQEEHEMDGEGAEPEPRGNGDGPRINAEETAAEAGGSSTPHWSQAGATCVTCGVGFDSPGFETPNEQRAHFRSDWHRLNLKRKLGGRPALSEAEFERLVGEDGSDCESISGSDTDSDIEEAGEEEAAEGEGAAAAAPGRGPKAVFSASDGRKLAVWRCLLEPGHQAHEERSGLGGVAGAVGGLRAGGPAGRWVVVLASGGHFAAALFQWQETKGKGGRPGAAQPEALLHKTFHRYVVRAKAGGRQSTKDATGKSIKSAGSALRRANEGALAKDIRATMDAWKQELASARLIFIHSSRSDTGTLFVGDGAPFSRTDPRIRRIPFPTRRPTLAETKRTVMTLANVWVVPAEKPTPRDKRPAKAAAIAAPAQPREAAAASPPKEPEEPLVPDSALHVAARAGDAEAVRELLEAGGDPGARDARGRPPYDVAADKPTRDAFRRFMAAEPDRWDYAASNIPSALTAELEEQQEAKRAEKEAKRKEKEKERKKAAKERKKAAAEEAKAAAEADVETAAAAAAAQAAKLRLGGGGGKKGGGGSGGKKKVGATEEAAARREAMAAAAEARMKALQAASQQQQLW